MQQKFAKIQTQFENAEIFQPSDLHSQDRFSMRGRLSRDLNPRIPLSQEIICSSCGARTDIIKVPALYLVLINSENNFRRLSRTF